MEVRNKLESIMQKVFDNPKIKIFDEMTANDVPEWDSLAHMDLILTIETDFKLKFSVDDIISLKNVGDMVRLLEKKLSA